MLLVLFLLWTSKLYLLVSHEVSLIFLRVLLVLVALEILLVLIAITLKLLNLFFSCHVVTLLVNQTNIGHISQLGLTRLRHIHNLNPADSPSIVLRDYLSCYQGAFIRNSVTLAIA